MCFQIVELEEKIIFCLAERNNLELKEAMDIYYNSFVANLIERGECGIQYLSPEALASKVENTIKA